MCGGLRNNDRSSIILICDGAPRGNGLAASLDRKGKANRKATNRRDCLGRREMNDADFYAEAEIDSRNACP